MKMENHFDNFIKQKGRNAPFAEKRNCAFQELIPEGFKIYKISMMDNP